MRLTAALRSSDSHPPAKKSELEVYLDIAGVAGLIDAVTSSEDVEQSKSRPRHFSTRFEDEECPSNG
jgi:hypothetical protein